jgi:hypothetical protein
VRWLLLVGLLAACDDEGEAPSYLITGPRLLAVQAEPPAVTLGGRATLRALVVDGEARQAAPSMAWRVCSPWIAVQDPDRDCVGADALPLTTATDGSAVLDTAVAAAHFGAGGVPAPTGCEMVPVMVIATADFGDLRLVARKEVRVRAAERRNPGIARVTLDGAPAERFAPGRQYVIGAAPVAELEDRRCTGDDAPGRPFEDVRFHVYVDGGELSNPHLDVEYEDDGTKVEEVERYTAPDDRGPVTMWVVAIDGDGGTAWQHLVLTAE